MSALKALPVVHEEMSRPRIFRPVFVVSSYFQTFFDRVEMCVVI